MSRITYTVVIKWSHNVPGGTKLEASRTKFNWEPSRQEVVSCLRQTWHWLKRCGYNAASIDKVSVETSADANYIDLEKFKFEKESV